jgi:hypothetical protein
VPRQLWNRVAASLQQNNQAHRTGKSESTPSLLTSRLFDTNGVRYTPTHAVKNAKRYRYYTSQTVVKKAGAKPDVTRFPAEDLEQFVKSQILSLLQTPDKFTAGMKNVPAKQITANRAKDVAKKWPTLETTRQNEFVKKILKRVTIGNGKVWIEIDKNELVAILLGQRASTSKKMDVLNLTGDFQILRRGGEIRVIGPEVRSNDETVTHAIGG